MIVTQIIIYLISLFVIIINGEQFCQDDRKLLLGGVFNYDNTIYAYSWKEVNSIQLWLVWRFQLKNHSVTEVGTSSNVDQLLLGVPLFRAGFGLNCFHDKCKNFKDLVFIFFQNSYKVFRVASQKFTPEAEATNIPWGLKPRGDVSEWYFGTTNMDNINGIVFSPVKMQLFMVSKNSLYSSAVDLSAAGLKWSKLSENPQLSNSLGGFISGTDIFFNKNDSPDNILLKYDLTGILLDKISVWKYFKCSRTAGAEPLKAEDSSGLREENNKKTATILLASIVVAVVLTNIVAAVFWISVYNNKNSQLF